MTDTQHNQRNEAMQQVSNESPHEVTVAAVPDASSQITSKTSESPASSSLLPPRTDRVAATDTPEIARKRQREARTVSQMVAIYCKGHHPAETRTESSHAGEALCETCKALDDYAVLRTMRCRKMGEKISCDLCENHCYAKEPREKIREVMRYSGPRMMKYHPIAAIRHLAGKIGSK